VTTSAEVAPDKNRKEIAARIAWIVLICATLYVCYFSRLGAIGLVGPDEPRYAWIARDMAESGDWITPRLYGEPWFEKPPLFYWGAALSFKLFGVSETTARLPSALCALFATLALAWLAWRFYGAAAARCLLLLLPTTAGMIGFSHAAATDMPFSGMLTIAMVCAAAILGLTTSQAQDGVAQHAAPLQKKVLASKLLLPALFGFFLGLAVLAKGPAAIILCGGTFFWWVLLTKHWREAFRLLHPVAIATFFVTALPWYIVCARRNPDFLRIFIVEHNFKRYLTSEFQHIQPRWFYIPVILVGILPWTSLLALVPGRIKQDLRNCELRNATIFLFTWAIFPLLFFSASQSKLPGYILPAIPPIVLLSSRAVSESMAMNSRFARAVLVGCSLSAIVMFAGGVQYSFGLRSIYQVQKLANEIPSALIILGFVCLLSFIAAVLTLWGRLRISIFLTVASLLFFFWSADLNQLDSQLSAREICSAITRLNEPADKVFLCSMPRSYTYAFNFYLKTSLREWSQHDSGNGGLVVVGSPACWSQLQGMRYHLRSEMNFARWPVVEVEATSVVRPNDGKAQ
jgi:4-amino-4-deoxy-L-arabinose transferase-like glycosyltransferase